MDSSIIPFIVINEIFVSNSWIDWTQDRGGILRWMVTVSMFREYKLGSYY